MEEHIDRYTKYIHETLQKVNIDTATYMEHLHKVFEWYGCISLSRQSDTTVLRWEDVPADLREEKCMSRDMGIDALDIIGKRMIQMKLYHGAISWRALSTFLACHHDFMDHNMILYRNTESQVCDKIADYIKKKIVEDRTVTDAEFRKECKRIQNLKIKKVSFIEKKDTRPYQQDAKHMMEQAHERKCNLIICLPTGTGKTWVVLDYHLEHRDETTLILVPTRVLLGQWNDACKELGIQPYLVDSNHHRDLKKYNGESIVICVYDSYKNIYDKKDLWKRIVADEAHHIFKPERYMETEDECDDFSEEDEEMEEEEEERSISSMSLIRDLHRTNRMIYLSATLDKPDDETLYYEYKVRQAISDGYLCDYQFIFPIFEQKYTTNQHLAEYLIHRQNETHCLIYASNCKEGKEFVDMLNVIQAGCAGYIDADTTATKRTKLFADFESGKIRFLINIRVLVEGFNAPHIRSIFFLRVSSSEIFIIQAIGRALRLHPDKIKATIYVPFTHEEDIDRIQAFLTQLSTYDERIKQSLMQKKVGGYLSLEHGEVQEDDEKTDDSVFEFRYNLIVDRMGNSNQLEEMAIKRALEYKAFYEKFGRKPKHIKDYTTNESRLAQFFGRMKSSKKGITHMVLYPEVECIFIDLFGEYWFEDEHKLKALKNVVEYIKWMDNHNKQKPSCVLNYNKHKKKPTSEQEQEHRLATWFSNIAVRRRGNRKCYVEVEEILIKHLGDEWYKARDLEALALEYTNSYIAWYDTYNRHASEVLDKRKNRKQPPTDDEKEEHELAQWYGRMRTTKNNPTRKSVIYLSVEKILIDKFGEDWYKNRDLEGLSLKYAEEYVSFFTTHKRIPRHVYRPKSDLEIKEKQLNQWFGDMKKTKTKKGKRKLYPSVDKILVETFGEKWYENIDFEQVSLDKAHEYIGWFTVNKKHPMTLCKSLKKTATDDRIQEADLADWINHLKQAKKSTRTQILYPSVEKIIVSSFGESWYENIDREGQSLIIVKEYIDWYNTNKRHPSQVIRSTKERESASDDKKYEQYLSSWMQHMKKTKKKPNKKSMKLWPSVEKILIETVGEEWYN